MAGRKGSAAKMNWCEKGKLRCYQGSVRSTPTRATLCESKRQGVEAGEKAKCAGAPAKANSSVFPKRQAAHEKYISVFRKSRTSAPSAKTASQNKKRAANTLPAQES